MRWFFELVFVGSTIVLLLLAMALPAGAERPPSNVRDKVARHTADETVWKGTTQVGESAEPDATDAAIPCEKQPRWYKGSLHAHSFWSDGRHFPESILKWYKGRGYHFVSLTDHDRLATGEEWLDVRVVERRAPGALAAYLSDFGRDWVKLREQDGRLEVKLASQQLLSKHFNNEHFLLLSGEEISDRIDGKPVHVNAFNLDRAIEPQGGQTIVESLRRNLGAIAAAGQQSGRPVLGQINHPNYGWALTAEQVAQAERARLIEIYSGQARTRSGGDKRHPSAEQLWDIANTVRTEKLGFELLYGVAVDDSHEYLKHRGSLPGRGWVQVRAEKLTIPALLRALEQGEFYASSGVELRRVERRPDELFLEIEGEPELDYDIQFIGSLVDDGVLAEKDRVGVVLSKQQGHWGSYRFRGNELFVRAVVVSPETAADGKTLQRAWTQPVLVRSASLPVYVSHGVSARPLHAAGAP